MSRIHFQPRTVLRVAALAAVLLGTACTDSTAPSSETSSAAGSGKTQSPTGASTESPDGLPALGEAPKLDRPAPGDSAAAPLGISFLRRLAPWYDSRYARGPGIVRIYAGSASCGNLIGQRFVNVRGISVTEAPVNGIFWKQLVATEYWLYRHNGTSWVYVQGQRVDTRVGGAAEIPDAWFNLSSGGFYHVKVRFTWFAEAGTGWFRTAEVTYDYDGQAEYTSSGSTGAGYCKIS